MGFQAASPENLVVDGRHAKPDPFIIPAGTNFRFRGEQKTLSKSFLELNVCKPVLADRHHKSRGWIKEMDGRAPRYGSYALKAIYRACGKRPAWIELLYTNYRGAVRSGEGSSIGVHNVVQVSKKICFACLLNRS